MFADNLDYNNYFNLNPPLKIDTYCIIQYFIKFFKKNKPIIETKKSSI